MVSWVHQTKNKGGLTPPFVIIVGMQRAGQLACGLVLVWAAWAMLHGLGQGSLQLYDEGTYAKVVEEMLASGDYLSFTLWGSPWFEKPPLYFWLAGAATTLTHSDVLGVRLPAALFGIAVVCMVMLLAHKAAQSYWLAALAGGLLVVTEPFVQGAREARFDLLIAFFILLAYYAAWQALLRPRGSSSWYIVYGVAVALAVLSKSVVAMFAAAALPALSLWTSDWSWTKNRAFWLGVGIAIVIVAPWHVYEWWQWGSEFWRQYIGFHVVARFEHNLFVDPALQTDYWARLLDYAKPLLGAFLLALVCLPLHIRGIAKELRAHVLSVLTLIALITAVYWSSQTRALPYLLPLYPLAALFAALSIDAIKKAMLR